MLRPYHFVAGRSDETFGRYLVIAAIVFALCWLFYYAEHIRFESTFPQSAVVIVLFMMLYFFFGRTYFAQDFFLTFRIFFHCSLLFLFYAI